MNSIEIFVFGSNLAGRHGAGSAKEALDKHGAIYGRGTGRQGNSWAIPTKDAELRRLPLEEVQRWITRFVAYAMEHPADTFNVVEVGCGLAGYRPEQIAPLFKEASKLPNVNLSKRFRKILESPQENKA